MNKYSVSPSRNPRRHIGLAAAARPNPSSASLSPIAPMATTPTAKKKRKQPPLPAESKKLVREPVAAVAEGEENMGKKKKTSNEIDEIFQGKRAKKSKTLVTGDNDVQDRGKKQATATAGGGNSKKAQDKKKEKRKVDPDERIEARGRGRRTADGLAIYSADELGWGNAEAGGTPLCPFDCSCCF